MIVLFSILCLIYALYACWLVCMLAQWHRSNDVPESCTDSSHLCVIIPFRDETNHLPVLLEALQEQIKEVPGARIVLVDDHSTDNSFSIAHQFQINNPYAEVIRQHETHGKKMGVDIAVSRIDSEWIVTLDADIQPCEGWLKRIAAWTKNNQNDMLILPLHMGPAQNFIGHLQEVEFASVMAITGGMALAGQPILCNGGNLCFRKEAYARVRTARTDMHITSGDDVFLLNALKPFGKVVWIHDPGARVSTAPKASFTAFAAQRLRWMGKAGFIRDRWLQATAWLTFLANGCLLIAALAAVLGHLSLPLFAAMVTCKVLLDGWLILRVGNWLCIKQLKRFYLVLVFIYPFYATLFPLMSQIVKPSWKGRTTNNR